MEPFPDIASLVHDVTSGRTAPEQLVSEALDRLDTHGRALGAVVTLDRDGALLQARAVAGRIAAGERPPLAGLPVAVKDNICTRGLRTTCASRMLEEFVPPYDATVVARLLDAGAIVVAKTNLDEFGMGSSTENSAFFPVKNPWDLSRTPGGSSGGSAVAVTAGLVPAALGTDTGGSVRQPAAFTGTVGLRPTYGRVSRFGLVSYGSSLDQVGTLTRSVEDAARLLGVIAGRDPHDATSADEALPDLLSGLSGGVSGLRVGLPREYFGEGVHAGVRQRVREAAERLAGAGAGIADVSLPHTAWAIPTYYIVVTSEASSNLARYGGVHFGRRSAKAHDLETLYSMSRAEGFGREVVRRIMLGTFSLSAGHFDQYYGRAMRARTLLLRDFEAAFRDVDVLVAPATPSPPFRLGEKTEDPLEMYLEDALTAPASLAGLPGLVVPGGFVDVEGSRLPAGVQILGPPFAEALLLRVGRVLEGAFPDGLPLPEVAA